MDEIDACINLFGDKPEESHELVACMSGVVNTLLHLESLSTLKSHEASKAAQAEMEKRYSPERVARSQGYFPKRD